MNTYDQSRRDARKASKQGKARNRRLESRINATELRTARYEFNGERA